MIYLDPSQLWNCLAQFHGVIYKDSSAESSCILRSFLFPRLLSRSQPWELFCSSRYFLSLWSISHGLTSHFWGAFVKRPRKYPEIYLFGFSSCSKHPSPQGALLSGQPSIVQQKLGEWLLSLPVSYLLSSRSSVKQSPDRAVGVLWPSSWGLSKWRVGVIVD